MKKSILSSVTAAQQQSPAPELSFLFTKRIWIMGVINATPDSFYAGSRAGPLPSAVALAQTMIEEGADVLDIGGESTRPGSEEVSSSEELARVLPIVDAIRQRWPSFPISMDTRKADVAHQALAHGANVINDISAFRHDPAMVDVVAEHQCPVVLMHMQGSPATMQEHPRYDDVVSEVKRFFEERLSFLSRHHVRQELAILDPGIGFGKTLEHNMTLLKHLDDFVSLGRPLLVGVSRKSFIGKWLGQPSPRAGAGPLPSGEGLGEGILPPQERLEGSLAAGIWAAAHGAGGLRVHDVGATRRALLQWEGIRMAS